jgi:hypothetical protein
MTETKVGKVSMVKLKYSDREVEQGLVNDPVVLEDYERRQEEAKKKAEDRKKKEPVKKEPVTEKKMRN